MRFYSKTKCPTCWQEMSASALHCAHCGSMEQVVHTGGFSITLPRLFVVLGLGVALLGVVIYTRQLPRDYEGALINPETRPLTKNWRYYYTIVLDRIKEVVNVKSSHLSQSIYVLDGNKNIYMKYAVLQGVQGHRFSIYPNNAVKNFLKMKDGYLVLIADNENQVFIFPPKFLDPFREHLMSNTPRSVININIIDDKFWLRVEGMPYNYDCSAYLNRYDLLKG